MITKHIAAQFDADFNALASRLMALGGLVEAQTRQAMMALLARDANAAQQVFETELRVDQLEIELDRELSSAFCRRQPKASELRLLTAISRATCDLERAGDEAELIARTVRSLEGDSAARDDTATAELWPAADLASGQLRRALDAFARLDTGGAIAVLRHDRILDAEFDRFLANMAARMTRQPRSIAAGVDLVLVARALQRIGDHATNIAECIIYIVQGADVRHVDLDTLPPS